MILVKLSKCEYEYDVRTLINAFYPEEKVTFDENNKLEDILLVVDIIYQKDEIRIAIRTSNGQEYLHTEKSCVLDRKEYKNCLKKMLYYLLSNLTNKKLPWGTLTGIRPIKLPMEKLKLGESDGQIINYMKNEYLCSDEKIELSLEIAKRELKLMEEIDNENGYSIYIGIPFCPSTCLYCSFTSYSIEKYSGFVEDYLKALYKEIDFASRSYNDKKLTTIYLGGGTPTTLTALQLEELLIKINTSFNLTYLKELTVEAGRPDSITYDKLRVLKEQGVTRISINPQTMKQETLDLIGRKHTITQIEEAFYMAREIGHENINMDIILGLPGETINDVVYTLDGIHKMDPDSLTVHTLAIKRAANLNIYKERYSDFAPANTKEMLRITKQFTNENDYLPYYLYRQKNMTDNLENIGYSKYGKEGLYNILIMEEVQTIIALGAGASSKIVFPNEKRIERVENVKSIKDYVERIDEMILRKKAYC